MVRYLWYWLWSMPKVLEVNKYKSYYHLITVKPKIRDEMLSVKGTTDWLSLSKNPLFTYFDDLFLALLM